MEYMIYEWGSCHNLPKTIFYLLKGDYICRTLACAVKLQTPNPRHCDPFLTAHHPSHHSCFHDSCMTTAERRESSRLKEVQGFRFGLCSEFRIMRFGGWESCLGLRSFDTGFNACCSRCSSAIPGHETFSVKTLKILSPKP